MPRFAPLVDLKPRSVDELLRAEAAIDRVLGNSQAMNEALLEMGALTVQIMSAWIGAGEPDPFVGGREGSFVFLSPRIELEENRQVGISLYMQGAAVELEQARYGQTDHGFNNVMTLGYWALLTPCPLAKQLGWALAHRPDFAARLRDVRNEYLRGMRNAGVDTQFLLWMWEPIVATFVDHRDFASWNQPIEVRRFD